MDTTHLDTLVGTCPVCDSADILYVGLPLRAVCENGHEPIACTVFTEDRKWHLIEGYQRGPLGAVLPQDSGGWINPEGEVSYERPYQAGTHARIARDFASQKAVRPEGELFMGGWLRYVLDRDCTMLGIEGKDATSSGPANELAKNIVRRWMRYLDPNVGTIVIEEPLTNNRVVLRGRGDWRKFLQGTVGEAAAFPLTAPSEEEDEVQEKKIEPDGDNTPSPRGNAKTQSAGTLNDPAWTGPAAIVKDSVERVTNISGWADEAKTFEEEEAYEEMILSRYGGFDILRWEYNNDGYWYLRESKDQEWFTTDLDCVKCFGSGRHGDTPCYFCQGTGKIIAPKETAQDIMGDEVSVDPTICDKCGYPKRGAKCTLCRESLGEDQAYVGDQHGGYALTRPADTAEDDELEPEEEEVIDGDHQRVSTPNTGLPTVVGNLPEMVCRQINLLEEVPCGLCGHSYEEGGEGYDGLCPRCADATDGEDFEGMEEEERRQVFRDQHTPSSRYGMGLGGMWPSCLFQAVVDAGIEYDHHESDLYIPNTPETRALCAQFDAHVEPFISNIDGAPWLSIPFAYVPFWERKPR